MTYCDEETQSLWNLLAFEMQTFWSCLKLKKMKWV